MNIKSILLFVWGLVIGGAAGVFGTKKYFKDKYEKLYEEDHELLEEYYERISQYKPADRILNTCGNCIFHNEDSNWCECHGEKHEDNEEGCRNWAEKEDDNEVNPPSEIDSIPGGRMTPEERADIKKKLNQNWQQTTNYAAMYRGNRSKTDPVDDSAESVHPLDQGEDGEEPECCDRCQYYESGRCQMKDEMVDPDDFCNDFTLSLSIHTPDEEAFDEHQKNKNKPPKIISAEAYENLPGHIETVTLYFYAFDEMLTDENEEPVEEPERLIGDALTKYGFADGPERLIFVMNYAQDVCYEVQKLDASWTDTH